MGEVGTVIELKDNIAVVKLQRTEACAKCKACTAGMSKEDMIIEANNICGAKMGDSVNVEIKVEEFLKATVIMYVIPLFTMTIGFVGTYFLLDGVVSVGQNAELISFFIGILFMCLTYFVIKLNEGKLIKKKNYMPVIDRVV